MTNDKYLIEVKYNSGTVDHIGAKSLHELERILDIQGCFNYDISKLKWMLNIHGVCTLRGYYHSLVNVRSK